MVCVRTPFEDECVNEPAVEADPYPHTGLRIVGVLGRNQVVEVTVKVRHLQHRHHPRDGLVLGRLPSRRRHEAGVTEPTDALAPRPKKNPAVINSSDVP